MLCFHNSSILEPQLITTFGANIKPGDSPIGYFGTGLKYAIASILRGGGKLTIMTNTEDGKTSSYDFTVMPIVIRDTTLSMIYMITYSEDAPTGLHTSCGFTKDLGKNWQPWMVYRELWSNAKDEGGGVTDTPMSPSKLASPGTRIIVQWEALDKAHTQASDFLLLDDPAEATLIHGNVELYPGESAALFYRGIKVTSLNPNSLYTWNILETQKLTEDRTLDSYTAGRAISKALAMWNDQPTLEIILSAAPKYWEHSLNFDSISELSPEFRAALQTVRDHEHANASARRTARSYYSDDFMPTPIPPTPAQAKILMAARDLLNSMGFPEFKTWHIGKDSSLWGEFANSKTALFISPVVMASKDFLAELMAYVASHDPDEEKRWDSYRTEKLFLAHWASEMPFPHEVLAQYLPGAEEVPEEEVPEETPSEAVMPEETALSDEIPF